MARKDGKIPVAMENACIGVDGNGADEAVDQLWDGFPFPAAESKQGRSLFVVPGCHRQDGRTCKQSTEVMEVSLVLRASQQFQEDRVADRDLAAKQRRDSITGPGPGIAKKLDPYGRIARITPCGLSADLRGYLPSPLCEGSGPRRGLEILPQGFEVRN